MHFRKVHPERSLLSWRGCGCLSPRRWARPIASRTAGWGPRGWHQLPSSAPQNPERMNFGWLPRWTFQVKAKGGASVGRAGQSSRRSRAVSRGLARAGPDGGAAVADGGHRCSFDPGGLGDPKFGRSVLGCIEADFCTTTLQIIFSGCLASIFWRSRSLTRFLYCSGLKGLQFESSLSRSFFGEFYRFLRNSASIR